MVKASSTPLDVLARDRAEALISSSLSEVWRVYDGERASGRSPFSAAIQVASRVDRLGFAFAVGYPAALEHMIGPIELPCALCVTEAGGNSPRAIATTLEPTDHGYRLRGAKSFVTLGTLAKTLFIACRTGERPDGRPELALVRVPADRDGVVLHELPATPFAPEVPHARVELQDVEVTPIERLPGDGYLDYVKPFRTIEDIHVLGAALGYLAGLALRVRGPADLIAELGAALVALDAIRTEPALDPRVHVALHGVLLQVKRLLESSALARLLESVPDDERARWSRDWKLLEVASKAREARFARACSELW